MNASSKPSRHSSKFGAVLVSELNIDPSAQRKLSMPWVNSHIERQVKRRRHGVRLNR